MSRRAVGALMLLSAVLVYSIDFAARHVAAVVFIADKTGNVSEQYDFAFALGSQPLLPVAVAAMLVGVAFLIWAEVRPTER